MMCSDFSQNGSEEELPFITFNMQLVKSVLDKIKRGYVKKVLAVVGAGISVNASIPDFRSKNNGIYHMLREKGITNPASLFSLEAFKKDPTQLYPFFKKYYSRQIKPTKLLDIKNLLFLVVTQNVDCLEYAVDIPKKRVFQIHGSLSTASCLNCKKQYTSEWFYDQLKKSDSLIICSEPECEKIFKESKDQKTNSKTVLVKPDVILFGEALSLNKIKFSDTLSETVDLVFIIGTSLTVQSITGIFSQIDPSTPIIIINLEKINFNFPQFKNVAFIKGDCDVISLELAKLLNWEKDMIDLSKTYI